MPTHAATGTPDAFVPKTTDDATAGRCLSPMVDPRNGAELLMVRSGSMLGDFQVPADTYGVRKGEAAAPRLRDRQTGRNRQALTMRWQERGALRLD